jgi:hypothetical protein
VDLVLYRTLADIDPDAGSLDDLLITLPNCRHFFTVETLDGHLSMQDYYQANEDGHWIALQTPPIDFRKPPTCPTCRTAVTANRYGRVYKRADLDILENNVAFRMSRSLGAIGKRVEALQLEISRLEETLRNEAASEKLRTLKAVNSSSSRQRQQKAILQQTRSIPLALSALDAGNAELHGISASEVKPWHSIVRGFTAAYRETSSVAATRSAHIHAWEASFTYLYQKEMDFAAQNPETAPRNPHEYAMRIAKLRVGQPQPRADQRFLVEAFWTSTHIRLALVSLARTWVAALSSRPSYPQENQKLWNIFISFILRSCIQDCNIALAITRESESHRQAVKTSLLIMRVEFEHFRFNVDVCRTMGQFEDGREQLAERAKNRHQDALEKSKGTRTAHLKVARTEQMQLQEREWLTVNFIDPVQGIIHEWEKLARSLRMDTFYEPVSLKEMEDIVRGFNFCELPVVSVLTSP